MGIENRGISGIGRGEGCLRNGISGRVMASVALHGNGGRGNGVASKL
jgi:hypothetical protein